MPRSKVFESSPVRWGLRVWLFGACILAAGAAFSCSSVADPREAGDLVFGSGGSASSGGAIADGSGSVRPGPSGGSVRPGPSGGSVTSGAGAAMGTGGSNPGVGTSPGGTADRDSGAGGGRDTGTEGRAGSARLGGAPGTGGSFVGSGTGGAATRAGGNRGTGGKSGIGGSSGTGGPGAMAGATGAGGAANGAGGATGAGGEEWPNIRVVGNHLCDRWGKPFALRSIESMFGSNGSSNATAFVAGHKALGANALGPLPNSSAMSAGNIEGLLAAAYEAGLVVGLNADHSNQGEKFFQNAQLQAVINHYPNVFLQEAVELGSEMSETQWVQAAKAKVDAYVARYPDKPLKIGSPAGGRSPRFALDRCEEVVEYYRSKGGRGGLIFTCQLYWKASTANWSYQEENGFSDGLPGILQAVDAMAASPCMFLPGLDHQDDVGYTGWREVMDHVRASDSDPAKRIGFQWWVYYNSGDPYDNDLTTDSANALAGITSTGRDVKARMEMDRQYVELGALNP